MRMIGRADEISNIVMVHPLKTQHSISLMTEGEHFSRIAICTSSELRSVRVLYMHCSVVGFELRPQTICDLQNAAQLLTPTFSVNLNIHLYGTLKQKRDLFWSLYLLP